MEFLSALWLPILLSAVLVFVASSVIHMVIPFHKADYRRLADEPALLTALRPQGLPPGEYYFPWAGSMKEMSAPEHLEKRRQGPVGFVTVMPSGGPAMGKNLVQWFLLSLAISLLTAYVCNLALAPGAGFAPVLRVAATLAILGYAPAYIQNAIWRGTPWGSAAKYVVDGIVYGLITGATFAWLWPSI